MLGINTHKKFEILNNFNSNDNFNLCESYVNGLNNFSSLPKSFFCLNYGDTFNNLSGYGAIDLDKLSCQNSVFHIESPTMTKIKALLNLNVYLNNGSNQIFTNDLVFNDERLRRLDQATTSSLIQKD
ncbi:unnamed protein product [Brachionus calyciflorus]|uniref:Uncharacterized protein n=1 Tax=Brachionus calyciflorus TaxID=104777 RepID=A0A813Z4X9_9BILA|nr:unnamed protein product [Brachionus calyciflorus]